MQIISELNKSLAKIEDARKQFIDTTNRLQFDPGALGRLASIDDALSKAEKEFHEFCVDLAMFSKTQN